MLLMLLDVAAVALSARCAEAHAMRQRKDAQRKAHIFFSPPFFATLMFRHYR